MDLKPAIVAPVARSTGIADRDRSVRFYRDVLGFEIHDAADTLEAVSGPARIQLCSEDYTPNDWTEPRRPGSAVIFFETDDVAAMHAAIRAHGGLPSEVEKVNWIKTRMFQIRDPDGHTLWFGQSYDKPHKARLSPMMLKALPELPFTDVAAAVAYYRDVLGFHVNYQQHDLGVMDRDAITMVLIARTDRQKLRLCLHRRCGRAAHGTAGKRRSHPRGTGESPLGPSRLWRGGPGGQSDYFWPAI
jgi:catechol 2,3-dioxygenase-like lactoylglutathione lyase family enzyme